MAETVTVYHPELDETKEVPVASVPVLEKSGWTTDLSITGTSPQFGKGEEL